MKSLLLSLACMFAVEAASLPVQSENIVVYRESKRFAGWPANHGIWTWGNEIVVGFERGYFLYNDQRHSIDWDRPAEHVLARSLDGGMTWTLEHPDTL